MNAFTTRALRLLTPLVLGLVSLACPAQQDGLTIKVGAEYLTGEYGGTEDIDDFYLPITARVVSGNWGLRATLPFVRVSGPAGTQWGPGGEPLPGTGERITESGLGDIVLGLTYYNLFTSADRKLAVDMTGKIKLGTADEARGLGNGETDFSLQVDVFHFLETVTLFGTAGYKVRGDPVGQPLDDVWFVSLGGSTRLSPRNRLGLALDVRPSAYPGSEDLRELSLYLGHRASDQWRYSGYLVAGFSDSSPDLGIGFSASYRY